MRIKRFRVVGYKNFTEPVELVTDGPITVIYGPNNIGKSNLLEAIGLPFELLSAFGIAWPQADELSREALQSARYSVRHIFNLADPQPIEIELDLEFSPDWLDGLKRQVEPVPKEMELHIQIHPGPPELTWHVTHVTLDGKPGSAYQAELKHLLGAVGRSYHVHFGRQRRFEVVHAAPITGRAGLPNQLCLDLYDRQNETNPELFARWTMFTDLVARFEDLLGTKTVTAVYDRKTERADLLLTYGKVRMSAALLGEGIQQLLALFGAIATTNATILGIEEPESNLSFELQRRVRTALESVAMFPNGPTQLFLTSHSPRFQVGPDFHMLSNGPKGAPELRRHPASQASMATGFDMDAPGPAGTAPLAWVTHDGLVQLPDWVREQLAVRNGGGVSFLPGDDGVRIVTDEQALEELGLDEE